MPASSAVANGLLAALLLAGVGCASLPGTSQVVGDPRAYSSVRLTYRLDAGQLGVPLAVSCVEGQQVSYQQVPSSPQPGRSVGILDIQYPHPAGTPGMALVGVVIHKEHQARRGMMVGPVAALTWWWPRDKDFGVRPSHDLHEAWVLDIPREELDALLLRLNQDGFYDRPSNTRDQVMLTTVLGGREIRKAWQVVPELDALMQRARGQGQLVSFQGTATPASQRRGEPASVVAYRQLQRQDQSPSRLPHGQAPDVQLAGPQVFAPPR